MKAVREDPPTVTGNTMQLGERHSIAIYQRDGRCWVAEFREGRGELIDAYSWFRADLGALRYSHGRRMAALATVQPMTQDVIEKVENLHRQAARRDTTILPMFVSVISTAWRRCGELATRIRGSSGAHISGARGPAE